MILFRTLLAFFRWQAFAWIGASPFLVIGYLFGGWTGFISAAIWAFAVAYWFASFSEWGISRAVGAELSEPLSRFASARVMVWPDPRPLCFVAKSAFFSKGRIYVSRGLVSLLTESEWRAFFEQANRSLREPGLSLQTLCSWISFLFERLSPRSVPHRVRDAFFFSLSQGLRSFLTGISGTPRRVSAMSENAPDWNNALRKINRDLHLADPSGFQASLREDRAIRAIALPLSVVSI